MRINVRLTAPPTLLFLMWALFVMSCNPSSAATYVNRVTYTNPPRTVVENRTFASQTWTPGGNPYVVEADVTVTGEFTIQPGVEVQVVNGGLYAYGVLTVSGASITGTNWKGIYLSPGSGNSVISNTEIRGAGGFFGGYGLGYYNGGYQTTAVYLDQCNATITGATIKNSETNGVSVYGASPTLADNTFENIGGEGHTDILLQTINCYPVVSGNAGSGTGNHAIRLSSGTTTTSGRLRKGGDNFPWLLTSGVYTVKEDHTLTVDPGVTVQVSNQAFHVYGTLKAEGTAAAPITFTTRSSTPAAGQWKGIYLGPQAGASTLNHARILYGGWFDRGYGLGYFNGGNRTTALYVDRCNATITNTTISDSETNGLALYDSDSVIRNNTFSNMGEGYYAIRFETPNTFPDVAANTATGTGFHGVFLPGGTQTVSGTWLVPGADMVYFQTGDRTIASTAALSIAPNVTVLMNNGTGLYVNGTLQAAGTPTGPVSFIPRTIPSQPGMWKGIYLAPSSLNTDLRHTQIRNSGMYNGGYGLGFYHGGYRMAALYVDECTPVLDHVAVLGSETNGIELYNSTADMVDCHIEDTKGNAVRTDAGCQFNVVRTSFVNNGSAGAFTISTDAASRLNPTDVSVTGNTKQGIEVRGGTIPNSTMWKVWGSEAPYVLSGNVTVAAGATFTLAPGAVVKALNTGLYVYGVLISQSAHDAITFASLRDDTVAGDTNGDADGQTPAAGDWKGIYLSPGSGDSVISNTVIRGAGGFFSGYGLGYYNGGYQTTAVYLDQCNATITGTTIMNSETNGVSVYGASPTLTDNTFENIGGEGHTDILLHTINCFPVVSGNAGSGTGNHAIRLSSGTTTTSGRLRKGGDNFPWLLTSGVYTVKADHTLTVDPGVTVQVSNQAFHVYGTLKAEGTAAAPITFTTRSSTPAAGQWKGIYLGPQAGASTLNHTRILYGGWFDGGAGLGYFNGGYRTTALYVDRCTPAMDRITIGHSATNGVELWQSNSVINSSLLYRISGTAVAVNSGGATRVVNATIVNAGTGVRTVAGPLTVVNSIIAYCATGAQGVANGQKPSVSQSGLFGNTVNVSEATGLTGLRYDDPQFVDPPMDNYRLAQTSPYVDAGLSAQAIPGLDLDGRPRLHGGAVDLGAYEIGPPVPYSVADAILILRIAGGLQNDSGPDMSRLQPLRDTQGKFTLATAARVCRMIAGLEPVP